MTPVPKRAKEHRLTPKMREVLRIMREHGITYRDDPDSYGVVTPCATALYDGQPWVNWRTAYALQARGLGKVTGWGEETEFVLFGGKETAQ